ncbi:ABC transporter G family member [Striga asiatica]|uniref:ABC transporter G family member n=1 Tax=Striga asiatica TaxID=4170 RepID=A0A5A7PN99_STRAF|nr:ABC transporter G family member [Striga asiatica]
MHLPPTMEPPPPYKHLHSVSSLLDDLSLRHAAHTRLQPTTSGGLSGGERRRVSIGLSLLHDPAVLILDEPTSGLDSGSALNVIQTLRSVTDSRHRTVILSIHQPSFKILSLIDDILLLSKGTVVHHGTLPSLEDFLLKYGFTVPPQLNPLEYAMEILDQLQDKTTESPPPENVPENPPATTDSSEKDEIRYKSSRYHEIIMLYSRLWKIIYRTKQLLLTNTLQALVVGIVLGTVYINIGLDKTGIEKRSGLFAFTLTFLLSSTTETLPIFIGERPIILRETSSGVYRLSSYIIANTLVFLPYLLAIAVLYSASVYFLAGLCSEWPAILYFVLVIWVILLMANSFVLFLSSIAPNFIAGTSLVTVLLAGFFLFSGYFVSKGSLPRFWLFMHYLSMYKYALDALLINEYSCLLSTCLVWIDGGRRTACMVTGRDVLQKKGLHEGQRWMNVYVLIGFFVLYRVLCLAVLMRRVSRSKR